MDNVIDFAAARPARITTGTRRNPPHRPEKQFTLVQQVIDRAVRMAEIRRGDIIQTTRGQVIILDDNLLASCGGERFFLKPDHIAIPENGVA